MAAATLFGGYVTLSLFPAPFSPPFHSSRPCRATHRHHLAIHLGPVLLITRLELRTRTGTRGSPGYVSRIPLKRSRGRGHAGAHGRPPALPARAIIVREIRASLSLFSSVSSPSSRLLLLSRTRTTGRFFFTPLATKGPLYAAGARVYFIRRMLFSVLRDYSRRVSLVRSFVRSFFRFSFRHSVTP